MTLFTSKWLHNKEQVGLHINQHKKNLNLCIVAKLLLKMNLLKILIFAQLTTNGAFHVNWTNFGKVSHSTILDFTLILLKNSFESELKFSKILAAYK